jgi:DNA-binding SARP family transcriptional activator/class 3 adenylate cyclase
MATAPTGETSTEVRTFLIADVRGYTRFTLDHGDEAAARLTSRFADLVEEVSAAHGGEVLELRGDEAMVVFRSPRGALRAAVDLQYRFKEEQERDPSLPFPVGIGLDAGEAIPVKGGFRGSALNLAARLCSLAGPGEVLASEGVTHLARKTEGIRYLDHGEVQLKGFAEPVRAVRVVPEGAELDGLPDVKTQPDFAVKVLGGFSLTQHGTELPTGSWQPRARTLFTLIATAPRLRRSRDELIDVLWPDAMPDAGASNLRYTVHLLRRAFGNVEPSPLLTQGGWIELNPAYRWDVDLQRFEALASRSDDPQAMEDAISLYGGEPLPEHRFEDWAAPIRERVERTWREVCVRAAKLEEEGGALEAAAHRYEALLDADPLDEKALQRLLPLLGKLGRQADALRLYARFEATLRRELDVEPALETTGLVQRLRVERGRAAGPVTAVAVPEAEKLADVRPSYPLHRTGRFAGRGAVLARVTSFLPQQAGGAAAIRLLMVGAEAGMGKTRLLAEVAEVAYGRRVLVLAGGSYEEEGGLPWGPMHDALLDYMRAQPDTFLRDRLHDLLPTLAQIVPELRTRFRDIGETPAGDAEAQRLRLFSTVAQTLERISSDRSLLLILDDLHWADDVTLQAVHFLLRQPGLDRVLLLGGYRPEEVMPDTPLGRLVAAAGRGESAMAIPLDALGGDDVAVLLEDRMEGACGERVVRTLRERSSGNPFFAIQMAGLLRQEGALRREAGRWEMDTNARVDLPPAVRETVGRRLRHITPEARAVLTAGSILGREFDYAPLEATADADEQALFDALDEIQEVGIVRESGEGYVFAHPLLWEVVYARIPEHRRRRAHERAGKALDGIYGGQAEAHAGELAWHFVESGNRERALTYSLLAGERAERGVAHAEAEQSFRQAVSLARSLGESAQLARALEHLGEVLRATRKLQDAIDVLDEAAQIQEALGDLDAEARIMAQWALAWYFVSPPDFAPYVARLRNTIRRVEARDGDVPSPALTQLYAALPRLFERRSDEQLAAAERAVAVGRATGNRSVEAAGLLRQGSSLVELGRYEEALSALDESIRLAGIEGDLFTLAAANHFAAGAAIRLGDGLRSAVYSRAALDAAARRGGLDQMQGILASFADRHFWLGDWDEVLRASDRLVALSQSLRGEVAMAVPFLGTARVLIHRGAWDDAEVALADAEARLPRGGRASFASDVGDLAKLRAEAAVLRDRPEEALEHLRPFAEEEMEEEWREAMARAFVAVASNAPDAELRARHAIERAEAERHLPGLAETNLVHGLALANEGETVKALSALEEAMRLAGILPFPYAEARARFAIGSILSESDRDTALSHLEAARGIFQRLGARPYLEGTEALLARLS